MWASFSHLCRSNGESAFSANQKPVVIWDHMQTEEMTIKTKRKLGFIFWIFIFMNCLEIHGQSDVYVFRFGSL